MIWKQCDRVTQIIIGMYIRESSHQTLDNMTIPDSLHATILAPNYCMAVQVTKQKPNVVTETTYKSQFMINQC